MFCIPVIIMWVELWQFFFSGKDYFNTVCCFATKSNLQFELNEVFGCIASLSSSLIFFLGGANVMISQQNPEELIHRLLIYPKVWDCGIRHESVLIVSSLCWYWGFFSFFFELFCSDSDQSWSASRLRLFVGAHQ